MADKHISRIIDSDGVRLDTKGLTDDEVKTVQQAWDDGVHDPGELRALIGLS